MQLEQEIIRTIKAYGPMNLAQYMKTVLMHPLYGYYTAKPQVLGKVGDFTTSPEISQLFGEIVGISLIDWARKRPDPKKPFQLVELGPGQGTLMADVLRVFMDIYLVLLYT